MSEDRISKLSERFNTHSVGRKPSATRSRERRSFYIASDLIERIDSTYQVVNHEIYPHSISKSVFLETILEHGLSNLDELKPLLIDQSASSSNSSTS